MLHRDKAPEQAHEAFIEMNRCMMVKDSFSEPGNPNQNPAEALGVKPFKRAFKSSWTAQEQTREHGHGQDIASVMF